MKAKGAYGRHNATEERYNITSTKTYIWVRNCSRNLNQVNIRLLYI